MDANDSETEEITIEVDGWTARRLKRLSWEHERDESDVTHECLKHGVLEYEAALGTGH